MEFVGREKELSELEKSYARGGSAIMVYGRRRIGKTSLLERFCEGKRNLFLRCLRDSDSANLEYFSDIISSFTGTTVRLSSFIDLMKELKNIIEDGKTVIVIDEFPYIASETVSSLCQHFIDRDLKKSDSLLILCGSYVSVMKKEGTDSGRPLYGRFRRMIRLGPMSFEETRLFHPGMSDEDSMKLYLTVGGVPRYHMELDCDTYEDCLKENYILNDWMMDETERLIDSELSNPKRALSILSAIGGGSTSLKEIAQKIGLDETLCSKCIHVLMDMGIVSILNPMFDAPKRPVYIISDNLFAFRYMVLQKRSAFVTSDHVDEFYESIRNSINTFLGKRFEYYCSEFIKKNFFTLEIGTWWMDRDDVHSEIDITARISADNINYDLFCECKFRKEPMSIRELEILKMISERLSSRSNPRYLLFSLSGFDGKLTEYAKDDPLVHLIGPDELFGHEDIPYL